MADQPQRERFPSRLDLFSNNKKLDIRAHQRTYEGAYTRSTIGSLSFAILILKLFSKEFLPIGAVYTVYGLLFYLVGLYRSNQISMYYSSKEDRVFFKTSGNIVLLLTLVSLSSYVALLVLILRM